MSKDEDKIKHSKRLLKDENAIKKQVKIAKSHGIPVENAHGFAKHHVMDCGQPGCILCGNRRKVWGEKTVQEERFDKQYKADQRVDNDDAND
jgi:hypothetical protein